MQSGNQEVDELKGAERDIVKLVQANPFPELLIALRDKRTEANSKSVKKGMQRIESSIFQLNPVMKNELIVVGGRLQFSKMEEKAKHPMMLPSKHHVTDLIMRYYHEMVGQMG